MYNSLLKDLGVQSTDALEGGERSVEAAVPFSVSDRPLSGPRPAEQLLMGDLLEENLRLQRELKSRPPVSSVPSNRLELVSRDQLIAELEALNTEREERVVQQFFVIKRLQDENASLRQSLVSGPLGSAPSADSVKTAFNKLEYTNRTLTHRVADLENQIAEKGKNDSERVALDSVNAELAALRTATAHQKTSESVKASLMRRAEKIIEDLRKEVKAGKYEMERLRGLLDGSLVSGMVTVGEEKKFAVISSEGLTILDYIKDDPLTIYRKENTKVSRVKKGFKVVRDGEAPFELFPTKAIEFWTEAFEKVGFKLV